MFVCRAKSAIPSNPSAFTLVELLTVIAIIGILATLLIPTVGSVLNSATRSQAASNIRQIALAYMTYANSGSNPRTIPLTVNDPYQWAAILAEKATLNDASLYFIGSDPAVANFGALPKAVGTFNEQGRLVQNNLIGTPVSWTLTAGISPRAPVSTTPLAWTRGLNSNGYWDTDSPWEGAGGHIVYLDGHVEWHENLVGDDLNGEGLLVRYTDKGATINILETLNPGARILEINPGNPGPGNE